MRGPQFWIVMAVFAVVGWFGLSYVVGEVATAVTQPAPEAVE